MAGIHFPAMLDLRSSNPVLADSQLDSAAHSRAIAQVATISGVAQKTGFAVSLAVVGGLGGAALVRAVGPGAAMGIWIAALVASLVCFFALWRRPERAVWAAPLYSILQGAMLGAFALMLDGVLAAKGIEALGGLGLQAFVITLAVTVAMLIVYRAGLIRPGKTFVAVLSTLTIGIGLAYLAQFVLGFFGISIPGLGLQSAFEGGRGAMIGLGINAVILLVASMWLVVDFQQIEQAVASRVGKEYEWYFAYGLMVTLVWIYLEALKLAFRAAMLAGDRK
jgi:uncharacterized YccA/Bax inhibitor family protein